MTNKSYIPILAVLGAMMLVVVAAIAPPQSFFGRDFVHAQTTDDARLLTLVLNDADDDDIMPTGDDAFDSDTMTYSVRAPSETNKVTVVTTKANSNASVTITPPDRDSAEGHQVNLRGGADTVIRVTVRSEDRSVTETYTITVYQVRTQPSDNANLSALSLSGATLSPAFASAKTSYTGRAPYGTDQITVSYTADIGAMVAIEGVNNDGDGGNDSAIMDDDDDASGHQIDIDAGAVTAIAVVVTAEDGAEEKAYIVRVYRENLVKSDNASLDTANNGLALSDGEIGAVGSTAIAFEYNDTTNSYPSNVRVASGVRAVSVAASTAHDGAVAVITPSDQDAETDGHQVLLGAGAKTDITVEVTAEDGTTTKTYSVTIYRARRVASDDADLSALSLSGVMLSPAFASDKIEYTGRAPYSTNEPTVSYTADVGATVTIEDNNGDVIADADANASGRQVDIDAGVVTEINVVVVAEAGAATEKTYTVMVYRENLVKSDNASLDTANNGLALSDGEIGAIGSTAIAFEYNDTTNSYPSNVRVANGVDAVSVAANTAHDGAVAVITPADQDSLTDGHQVLLGAGAKTDITVEVTAEDGTTTKTYSVTIYRARLVASDDADLSALSLSGVTLSPAFASDKIEYTGRAPYSTNEPTVSYTADVGATVTIEDNNGDVIADADANASGRQVDIDAGVVTEINVVVVAEAGAATEKTYTVMVYRENLPLSDNAGLAATATGEEAGLRLLSDGTTPIAAAAFTYNPAMRSYPNVRVPNTVQTITVEANTAQPGAVAVITPADQDSLTDGHQVILGAGAKTDITVEVTAEDGTTTETYSITIYRGRLVASNDAELSALSLSGVTLSPAFDSAKDEYIGTAANSTQLTTVSYTADVGVQMVDISVAATTPIITDADPAAPGYQVRLTRGQATVITITVTAENEETNPTETYIITVYRDAAASSDATLQSLTLSGLTLSPAFDAATTMYTAEVETLAMTMVEAMATHPGAMVEGTGEMSLSAGENTISVTVTAEDETTQTYTVTVTVMMGGTLLDRYDADDSGDIDLTEVSAAIDDYFEGQIDLDAVSAVIDLYFG